MSPTASFDGTPARPSRFREGRLRRERLSEYSTVMVRELLVNAIAHADYSRAGENQGVRVR